MAYDSLDSKRILVVDDDVGFVARIARHLREAGCDVAVARSLKGVVNVLQNATQPFDLGLIDIYLPEADGGEDAPDVGFKVVDLLRRKSPNTILAGMSNLIDAAMADQITSSFVRFYDKPFREQPIAELLDHLFTEVQQGRKPAPRSFIVHGRNNETKLALKNYLQNTLKLGEPVILHEQASQGRTVMEKFEQTARSVDLVFVILTPDDKGCIAADPDSEKRRARQNVIFEMGYFFAKLQRTSGRVILLHEGGKELPSDIAGIVYIDISNGVEAAGEDIRTELSEWL